MADSEFDSLLEALSSRRSAPASRIATWSRPLTQEQLSALFNALEESQRTCSASTAPARITGLELGSCCLGNVEAVQLAQFLACNSFLNTLNLKANNIGAMGAKALADMLHYQNTQIKVLDLSQNPCVLEDPGVMQDIAKHLERNRIISLQTPSKEAASPGVSFKTSFLTPRSAQLAGGIRQTPSGTFQVASPSSASFASAPPTDVERRLVQLEDTSNLLLSEVDSLRRLGPKMDAHAKHADTATQQAVDALAAIHQSSSALHERVEQLEGWRESSGLSKVLQAINSQISTIMSAVGSLEGRLAQLEDQQRQHITSAPATPSNQTHSAVSTSAGCCDQPEEAAASADTELNRTGPAACSQVQPVAAAAAGPAVLPADAHHTAGASGATADGLPSTHLAQPTSSCEESNDSTHKEHQLQRHATTIDGLAQEASTCSAQPTHGQDSKHASQSLQCLVPEDVQEDTVPTGSPTDASQQAEEHMVQEDTSHQPDYQSPGGVASAALEDKLAGNAYELVQAYPTLVAPSPSLVLEAVVEENMRSLAGKLMYDSVTSSPMSADGHDAADDGATDTTIAPSTELSFGLPADSPVAGSVTSSPSGQDPGLASAEDSNPRFDTLPKMTISTPVTPGCLKGPPRQRYANPPAAMSGDVAPEAGSPASSLSSLSSPGDSPMVRDSSVDSSLLERASRRSRTAARSPLSTRASADLRTPQNDPGELSPASTTFFTPAVDPFTVKLSARSGGRYTNSITWHDNDIIYNDYPRSSNNSPEIISVQPGPVQGSASGEAALSNSQANSGLDRDVPPLRLDFDAAVLTSPATGATPSMSETAGSSHQTGSKATSTANGHTPGSQGASFTSADTPGCGSMLFEHSTPSICSMNPSKVTNLSQVSSVFSLTPQSNFQPAATPELAPAQAAQPANPKSNQPAASIRTSTSRTSFSAAPSVTCAPATVGSRIAAAPTPTDQQGQATSRPTAAAIAPPAPTSNHARSNAVNSRAGQRQPTSTNSADSSKNTEPSSPPLCRVTSLNFVCPGSPGMSVDNAEGLRPLKSYRAPAEAQQPAASMLKLSPRTLLQLRSPGVGGHNPAAASKPALSFAFDAPAMAMSAVTPAVGQVAAHAPAHQQAKPVEHSAASPSQGAFSFGAQQIAEKAAMGHTPGFPKTRRHTVGGDQVETPSKLKAAGSLGALDARPGEGARPPQGAAAGQGWEEQEGKCFMSPLDMPDHDGEGPAKPQLQDLTPGISIGNWAMSAMTPGMAGPHAMITTPSSVGSVSFFGNNTAGPHGPASPQSFVPLQRAATQRVQDDDGIPDQCSAMKPANLMRLAAPASQQPVPPAATKPREAGQHSGPTSMLGSPGGSQVSLSAASSAAARAASQGPAGRYSLRGKSASSQGTRASTSPSGSRQGSWYSFKSIVEEQQQEQDQSDVQPARDSPVKSSSQQGGSRATNGSTRGASAAKAGQAGNTAATGRSSSATTSKVNLRAGPASGVAKAVEQQQQGGNGPVGGAAAGVVRGNRVAVNGKAHNQRRWM